MKREDAEEGAEGQRRWHPATATTEPCTQLWIPSELRSGNYREFCRLHCLEGENTQRYRVCDGTEVSASAVVSVSWQHIKVSDQYRPP